jgi:hypothetical protein
LRSIFLTRYELKFSPTTKDCGEHEEREIIETKDLSQNFFSLWRAPNGKIH